MLSCAFVGHKDCPKKIEERLYNSVESLIIKNNVSRFYVGTHGNFDYIVYKVLHLAVFQEMQHGKQYLSYEWFRKQIKS